MTALELLLLVPLVEEVDDGDDDDDDDDGNDDTGYGSGLDLLADLALGLARNELDELGGSPRWVSFKQQSSGWGKY